VLSLRRKTSHLNSERYLISGAVMLSEAKHLWTLHRRDGSIKQSEILRIAQNDILDMDLGIRKKLERETL
jgi:hypothetical protein